MSDKAMIEFSQNRIHVIFEARVVPTRLKASRCCLYWITVLLIMGTKRCDSASNYQNRVTQHPTKALLQSIEVYLPFSRHSLTCRAWKFFTSFSILFYWGQTNFETQPSPGSIKCVACISMRLLHALIDEWKFFSWNLILENFK